MGRSPCCDKSKVKRGSWSPEEDATLKDYLYKHGTAGNWIALPHKAGLQRCGKSCRLRWLNYLRPGIKHGAFTQDEQNIISNLYNTIGSRWSVIASHLPGRTDNDVKNYWNTKMRKKLNMPANSNTKTATDVAAAATCTTTTTVILDKATNFQASTDSLALPPTFPMPFSHNDNFTLPRSIFEGCSSNYSSDNSPFRPFSLGMDEKYGVDNKGILMDECSSYDNNADLFSIFNNDTELRRMSENH